tara:strand:- start:1040 stop:2020 length:981 start_codon:yes stop_codon:yes gene_type:complete
MNVYIKKKHTLARILGLLFSIAYGFCIIASVQRHFFSGSGDIASYVFFFDDFKNWTDFNYSSLEGDGFFRDFQQGVFRFAVFELRDLLNQSTITVLSYLAFITSSIIFCIYSVNIRSRKYLFNILPLFLMVFFTPRVMNLFASGIRSGIAFTILIVAIIYLKGAKKYILFGLSSLIHLSMLPIISLYFLFYMLNNKRIKSPFIAYLFILLLCSFLAAIAGNEFHVWTGVSSGIYYNFLVLYVGLLIIFTNKKAIKDIYGFISVGFILIVLFGFIIDFSFIRYVGNAIIIYLFFLINKGEARTIQVFTIGYAPFFILTLFYSIANHW